jgi:hypothetical protein
MFVLPLLNGFILSAPPFLSGRLDHRGGSMTAGSTRCGLRRCPCFEHNAPGSLRNTHAIFRTGINMAGTQSVERNPWHTRLCRSRTGLMLEATCWPLRAARTRLQFRVRERYIRFSVFEASSKIWSRVFRAGGIRLIAISRSESRLSAPRLDRCSLALDKQVSHTAGMWGRR